MRILCFDTDTTVLYTKDFGDDHEAATKFFEAAYSFDRTGVNSPWTAVEEYDVAHCIRVDLEDEGDFIEEFDVTMTRPTGGWLREIAMEEGMLHGCEAYNEAMGYD